MSYAIMRVSKHKSARSIGGMGRHANRTRTTPNADPDRYGRCATYTPASGWVSWKNAQPPNLAKQFNERLDDFKARGGKVRTDSVLAVELMLSASPDFFAGAKKEQFNEWIGRNVQWLNETFGKENILQVVLHLDETTPHLHAFFVPEIQMVETRGRKPKDPEKLKAAQQPKPALAASHWLDGRAKLGELQDRYADAMAPLGLERGLRGSGSKHQTIRSYYAKANAVIEGPVEVAGIKIPAPPELPKADGLMGLLGMDLVPRAEANNHAKEAAQKAALLASAKLDEERRAYRAAQIEQQNRVRRLEMLLRAAGGAAAVEELVNRVNTSNEALKRAQEAQRALLAQADEREQHHEALKQEYEESIAEWKHWEGVAEDKFKWQEDRIKALEDFISGEAPDIERFNGPTN
jgi:hypothetical protein